VLLINALARTRQEILADMDRQKVTIPAERLVRVALLKCGNSLIGSRIAGVQAALQSAKSSLFASSKFAGVMLATDLMRQVSYLSDNTVDQVATSRSAFRSASDHLAPQ
jgi:hypothetical protein